MDQDTLYRLMMIFGGQNNDPYQYRTPPYFPPGTELPPSPLGTSPSWTSSQPNGDPNQQNQTSQFPYPQPEDSSNNPIVQGIGNKAARPSAYDEPLESRWSEENLKHIGNMPRENKPNVWRRIGGVLTALDPSFSPQEQEYLRDPKYYREMEAWKAKQDAIETPMIQERLENQGIRTARRYETANQTAQDRIAMQDRHNREMEEIKRTVGTGKYKAIIETSTGEVFLYNDSTGELKPTGKRNLTKVEEIMIGAEFKNAAELEQIRARTASQIEVKKTEGAPQTINQNVNTTTTTLGGPENPSQVEGAILNRARKIETEYPWMKGWLIIDPSKNDVQIKPVGTQSTQGGGELTAEARQWLVDQIYEGKPPDPKITQTNRSSTTQRGGPISPVQQPIRPGSMNDPVQPPSNAPDTQPNSARPGFQLIMPPPKSGRTEPVWVPDAEVPNAIKNGGYRVEQR